MLIKQQGKCDKCGLDFEPTDKIQHPVKVVNPAKRKVSFYCACNKNVTIIADEKPAKEFIKTPGLSAESGLGENQGESFDQMLTGGDEDLDSTIFSCLDDLFEDAARIVVISQSGSTSAIQRKLVIGFNRSGKIMDQLEAAGIIGQNEGSKGRQVLVKDLNKLELLLKNQSVKRK